MAIAAIATALNKFGNHPLLSSLLFAISSGLSFWIIRQLQKTEITEWFLEEHQLEKLMQSIRLAAIILGAGTGATHFKYEAQGKSSFLVDTSIVLIDSETGKRLGEVSHSDIQIPKTVFHSISGDPNGLKINFQGSSHEAFTVKLGSSGYHPESVTIDSKSEKLIEMHLQPAE